MGATQYPVFTIGHSNHFWEEFIKLLLRHRIDEVVDVRSSPYSRYAAQFNHADLQQTLEDIGVGYEFLGGELGGRPADSSCYDGNGQVQYDRVAETDAFDDGIRQVMRRADDRRVVLLCTEKEPLECHRTLLVARALTEREVAVEHILSDSSLESYTVSIERLLDAFKLPRSGDMFRSQDDVISEALMRQAQKVAYTNDKQSAASYNPETGL